MATAVQDTASSIPVRISKESVVSSGIFPKNGPDPSARSWSHNPEGKTFGAQNKIPKQPLPSLESSCQRYLDALRPLQSDQEHEATKAAVTDFLHEEGPILHAQLKEYDAAHVNWFEHYCYEAFLGDNSRMLKTNLHVVERVLVMLTGMAAVVLNSNAFASFPKDPDPARHDQVTRAAALVRSTLEFSNAIREDEFPLEDMRGVPQCMYQYWWLFGAVRIPGEDGGRFRMDADARHIMVMCRGQIYRLYVLKEETFQIQDEAQIAADLRQIVEDSSRLNQEDALRSSIGAFTTENQETWSRCRRELVHASVRNGRNFAAIESSLFALCLDDSVPQGDEEVCRNMICGTTTASSKSIELGSCINRWYDKLAVIVTKSGEAGMNFEHTCSDGSADIRMACEVYRGSISPPATKAATNGDTPVNGPIGHHISFNSGLKKLEWDIPQPVIQDLLLAQEHLVDRIRQHQLATLTFHDYGKSFITSVGFSPDAYFQMGLHAAYVSMTGNIGNGFEPVLMRQFLHGRTDVVRTTTAECAAFARTFNDPSATAAQKIDALRTATTAHVTKFKECAKGLSHHRYLFVLNNMWKRRRAFLEVSAVADPFDSSTTMTEKKTTIFTDPGWSRLGTTVVMGSNVDNPFITYAGFGPPSAEGFTVCYYIRKDLMAMSVNSKNEKAQEYADAIERTFKAMKELLGGSSAGGATNGEAK